MLQKIGFPQPANDVFIAYCGPKDFDKAVKEEILLAFAASNPLSANDQRELLLAKSLNPADP